MARSFNPPPNWPKPPEGWQPPPGWQPDPAWGPAPEGWQLWVEEPDSFQAPGGGAPEPSAPSTTQTSGPASSGTAAAGAAAGAATGSGHAAPSFGGQDAGTGTSRMPQYQGGGFSNLPPRSGGGSVAAGRGGSKLPWILGAIIALLLVVMLILVLALTGVFGGNDSRPTADEQSQSQDSGGEADPGSMSTADATGGSSDPAKAEEATKVNVDPEGAKEIGELGEPVETFTEKDGEFELPRPDGEDAPQLVVFTNTGDGYAYLQGEREDGSSATFSGASANESVAQLVDNYSFDNGNPVTKVWSDEEDAKFELKVYSLKDLETIDGGSIKGDGNAVFLLDVSEGSSWYKMSHNGSSNFIVHAMIDYEDGTYGTPELAANEIGRTAMYTEYGKGLWLVSVQADGKWGFEETTEDMAREAAVAEIMEN